MALSEPSQFALDLLVEPANDCWGYSNAEKAKLIAKMENDRREITWLVGNSPFSIKQMEDLRENAKKAIGIFLALCVTPYGGIEAALDGLAQEKHLLGSYKNVHVKFLGANLTLTTIGRPRKAWPRVLLDIGSEEDFNELKALMRDSIVSMEE